MIDLNQYQAITFDCYGTLIDWETGILTAIKSILTSHHINLQDDDLLENFANFESQLEQGEYISYREVLQKVVQKFGEKFDFAPTELEINSLANSIQYWQPFADTVDALKLLKQKFQLVIISNVDDDLFAFSAKKLEVEFDQIITAQQVKSYKPSLNNFQQALERIKLPTEQILHVAASVYHDIIPAKSLEFSAVWVNRRMGQTGSGATLTSIGEPDLEVPDLKTLATYIQ
ncbi:haloacid dehalogenase type II [Nostoc sp. CMAA1605]|uniref:haloacid dehalogenase type II n=1 Tax=Nostoc sp. CMAA1605 TaxID=2055159 RepID=UPI001F3ED88E|nr:haloacid dehalogenase type II [Nostoc sp. CMAA1605]MCF4969984.1 haloacid dehalogenase type II [Nostoc sp. CMAA1605]